MRVAIVGGGISGLATAFRLFEVGIDSVIFESEPHLGGKVQSERRDGYLVEHGPNGFLSSRETVVTLARDVGLGDQLLPAHEDAKDRYLFVDGRLQKLPGSPPALLTNPVLSFGARLRILWEYFVKRRRDETEETVFDFTARRLGREAASRLVDAMVTGIYAGDPKQLSLRAAFPRLAMMEREFGGVIRGMIALRKAARARGEGPARLTCFAGGLGDLIQGLSARLDDHQIRLNQRVSAVTPGADSGWAVKSVGAETESFDAVVMTTPTPVTAGLVAPFAPGAVAPLQAIPYADATVVALGYPEQALSRPLDGFGFLVPSSEKRDVLGVLWSSTLFPNRAPEGHVLLRTIVGGVRRPDLAGLNEDDLIHVVTSELSAIFQCDLMTPSFQRVVRWPGGIPQYNMGHNQRIEEAKSSLQAFPGLLLSGNGVGGVSVADCAGHAEKIRDILTQNL